MDQTEYEDMPPADAPDLLSRLPYRSDRKTGARLVTRYKFPISDRTLERWPVNWLIINGKATAITAELFAEADAQIAAAEEKKELTTA